MIKGSGVLVVGGGIAGLAIAALLRRLGATVDLVEKTAQWRPVGAGLLLQENALCVLGALGLDASVTARSMALAALVLSDAQGRPLAHVGGASRAIHRADLHQCLLDACDGVDIRLGVSVSTLNQSSERVDVTFSDGGSKRYDLVIGADGVHSTVRTLISKPPADEFNDAGYGCWRCVVPNTLGLRQAKELWGDRLRVGIVPLNDTQIYSFLVMPGTMREKPDVSPSHLKALYRDFSAEAQTIISSIDDDTVLLWNNLGDLPVYWGSGRVVLLGDAAHAATPNMGQGAAMALEDVASLAYHLTVEPRLDHAIGAFIRERIPRVTAIQKQSAQTGRMGQLASPFARRLRNIVLRGLPDLLLQRSAARLVRPGVILADRLAALLRQLSV